MNWNRSAARLALLVLGCASLVLISGLDYGVYQFLDQRAPSWKVVPDLRIPSLLVTFVLCVLLGRESLQTPKASTPWRLIAICSASWLTGTMIAVFLLRVWIPALDSTVDKVAFEATGLLAEEFLFRGAVFTLALSAFPGMRDSVMIAVVISSSLFGLQHFGYHGWHFEEAAITQVIYTSALGALLGLLRGWSGSLWVPTALHILNNLVPLSYRLLGN